MSAVYDAAAQPGGTSVGEPPYDQCASDVDGISAVHSVGHLVTNAAGHQGHPVTKAAGHQSHQTA